MATYDNLPVYKKTYDLLLQLFRLGQNMERDYRYTIGENLKKEVIELLMNVYRANCRSERTALIEAAREHTEVLRLLLRLLHDFIAPSRECVQVAALPKGAMVEISAIAVK